MKVACRLHFNNYGSPGLNQNLSSLKFVHAKFSFWFLLPKTGKRLHLNAEPHAAPQAPRFCDLPSSHPPHLSKQLIQYWSLKCQPLVRSKGLFCLASPRELPSLFPLLLPSGDRPACSFSSCRAFPVGLCCERERQGLLPAGHGSELHAYSPSHGAQRLHGHTGRHVVPMLRELFAAAHTQSCVIRKI